jgi:hypothetical protein
MGCSKGVVKNQGGVNLSFFSRYCFLRGAPEHPLLGYTCRLLSEVKRELKRIYINGCRYNERLNDKMEGSTHLTHIGLCG